MTCDFSCRRTRFVEFALHVAADVFPERLEPAFLDAERLEEFVVELRQRGSATCLDLHREVDRLARPDSAPGSPRETWRRTRPAARRASRARPASKSSIICPAPSSNVASSACRRRTPRRRAGLRSPRSRGRHPGRAAFHGSQVFRCSRSRSIISSMSASVISACGTLHRDPAQVHQFDGGKHLEGGGELEVAARFHLDHFEARLAGRGQRSSWRTASKKLDCISSPATSARTAWP
jgi:hypothetical protein